MVAMLFGEKVPNLMDIENGRMLNCWEPYTEKSETFFYRHWKGKSDSQRAGQRVLELKVKKACNTARHVTQSWEEFQRETNERPTQSLKNMAEESNQILRKALIVLLD